MNLIGQQISLRHPTLDDTEAIAKYCADIEISKFTFIPHPYTLRDAVEFVTMCIDDLSSNSSLHCAIVHNATNELIGMIGLNSINETHKRAELGYWVAKPFWGNGIMFEAIELITPYCFDELNLERVFAHVRPDNIGSWKVLEKAGYEREGLLRNHFCVGDIMYDHYIYSKLKD